MVRIQWVRLVVIVLWSASLPVQACRGMSPTSLEELKIPELIEILVGTDLKSIPMRKFAQLEDMATELARRVETTGDEMETVLSRHEDRVALGPAYRTYLERRRDPNLTYWQFLQGFAAVMHLSHGKGVSQNNRAGIYENTISAWMDAADHGVVPVPVLRKDLLTPREVILSLAGGVQWIQLSPESVGKSTAGDFAFHDVQHLNHRLPGEFTREQYPQLFHKGRLRPERLRGAAAARFDRLLSFLNRLEKNSPGYASSVTSVLSKLWFEGRFALSPILMDKQIPADLDLLAAAVRSQYRIYLSTADRDLTDHMNREGDKAFHLHHAQAFFQCLMSVVPD